MTTSSTAVQIFKIIVLGLMALVLAAAVIFCVLEVGNLNTHASVLQACMAAPTHAGCPATPITTAQISTTQNTANTLGDVGWIAALMLVVSVGGALVDAVRK